MRVFSIYSQIKEISKIFSALTPSNIYLRKELREQRVIKTILYFDFRIMFLLYIYVVFVDCCSVFVVTWVVWT